MLLEIIMLSLLVHGEQRGKHDWIKVWSRVNEWIHNRFIKYFMTS